MADISYGRSYPLNRSERIISPRGAGEQRIGRVIELRHRQSAAREKVSPGQTPDFQRILRWSRTRPLPIKR
jgi:hypothetical protein